MSVKQALTGSISELVTSALYQDSNARSCVETACIATSNNSALPCSKALKLFAARTVASDGASETVFALFSSSF